MLSITCYIKLTLFPIKSLKLRNHSKSYRERFVNRLSTKQNSHFNVLKFNVGASVINLKVNYQIAQTKMINESLLLCKFYTC